MYSSELLCTLYESHRSPKNVLFMSFSVRHYERKWNKANLKAIWSNTIYIYIHFYSQTGHPQNNLSPFLTRFLSRTSNFIVRPHFSFVGCAVYGGEQGLIIVRSAAPNQLLDVQVNFWHVKNLVGGYLPQLKQSHELISQGQCFLLLFKPIYS